MSLEKDNERDFGGEIPVTTDKSDEEFEIEVLDDTPLEDRNRKPLEEPIAEVTDEELEEYDEKVQKRIKKMTRGYHDERRAKEAATRERDEAVRFAQQAYGKAKQLEQQLADGSQVYIEKSVSEAETLLNAARQEYKNAYEAGDSDNLVDAQEKMMQATVALDQAKRLKPLTVAPEQEYSQPQDTTVKKPEARATDWAEKNEWFGKNTRMTALAHGIHAELVEAGINPLLDGDEYYRRIDAGMRDAFPQYFKSGSNQNRERASRAKPDTVVATATRDSAPTKVRLTSTQVAFAKKLNIPLEAYAREVIKLEREQKAGGR